MKHSPPRRRLPGILASVAAPLLLLCLGTTATTKPAAGPIAGATALPERSVDFKVFAYELELRIDGDHKRLAGREKIRLRGSADGLTVIAFATNGIQILSATSEQGARLPTSATDGRIEIRLPTAPMRDQPASVVLEYSVTAPEGVEFRPDAIYTSFQTCHWMVCRDRPDDKATFTLTMAVAEGFTLVASGARTSEPTPAGAPGRQVWKESVPSSPYLFGFAIGRFSRLTRIHHGTRLEYFAVGVDDAVLRRWFADDDRMLDFFVEKAGLPLPRPSYGQVVVDGDAAQEVSSFSILGRGRLEPRLLDPTGDWPIAHEMAHQFWGNLVTCADWSHFWLNEGLAVFMQAAYQERRWGRPAYEHELDLARRRHRFAIDAKFDVPLTFGGQYPSLQMKRAIVYSKGALFIDRLRTTMGERPFWRALKRYTRRFAGRAVVSEDFQRVFAAETDRNLSGLFDTWVYGPR